MVPAHEGLPPAVPFVDLQSQHRALKAQIDARIQRVLEHGQFIMGPEVGELEGRLSSFVGARHCVGVASGTEALLIALMALGVERGDEVITTSFSFAATAEVIVRVGAKPVLVDIESDTCNIDVAQIERHITSRTRVVIPVSLYGQCPDMDEINALASRRGIAVIEDAAQSFGALYKGGRSCALSTLGATSFFPSKPLGCYGDGGALFTNDDRLAQAAQQIRVHGESARHAHARIGVGGRLDTIQAAILLAKLERFEWELERRVEIAACYDRMLSALWQVERLVTRSDRNSVHAQYTVLIDHRDRVQEGMRAHGVPTAVHYPMPLYRQPAFASVCRWDDCPQAERAAARVLSLPMSPDLRESDQARVVAALTAAVQSG
jgi:UDP-2-acetamido-2-deoxy-ribo-hexuluronate aminotransferase